MPPLRDSLLGLVFAGLAAAAAAQAPALPPLPHEEARAVYKELLATYDGYVYTFEAESIRDEALAKRTWEMLQEPPRHVGPLSRALPAARQFRLYAFAIAPALRLRLQAMDEGERTGPVRIGESAWTVAQLRAREFAKPPTFEQALPHLPRLVAAGTLPEARQPATDPWLRARSQANDVRSADAVRKLPDGFDVGMLLSNGTTTPGVVAPGRA